MNWFLTKCVHTWTLGLCLTSGLGCSAAGTVSGNETAKGSSHAETSVSGTTADLAGAAGATDGASGSSQVAFASPGRALAGDKFCPGGAAEVTQGQRRLALVIGVSDYLSPTINDLKGPANDAQHMYDVLTGVYGFPKNNVCLLTNAQASTAQVLERFESRLVNRAQARDPVVIYFAGHGSQISDKNGDEPDEFDETLLLWDARTPGISSLTDDQFNGMLARLYAKTSALTVVVDACNSGSNTRDEAVSRWVPPESGDDRGKAKAADGAQSSSRTGGEGSPGAGNAGAGSTGAGNTGDGSAAWVPASMPEAVFVAAAADGTSALERDGEGLFTQALLGLLSENPRMSLSWQDVALQLPVRLRAARTDQVPYFSGLISRMVWDSGAPGGASGTVSIQDGTVLGWSVQELKGEEVILKGPPWMSGWSTGALVRVYPRTASANALKDPVQSLAMLEISRAEGPIAYAHRVQRASSRSGQGETSAAASARLEPGQLAILASPGQQSIKLSYSIRSEKLQGGLDAARARRVREAIKADDSVNLVVVEKPQGEFELQVTSAGQLQFVNATGRITNTFSPDASKETAQVVTSLWQHARQLALLNLKADGGTLFTNNSTLKVQIVPAQSQPPCAKGLFNQAAANQPQTIPLCHAYQVKVSLAATAPRSLLVGGLMLFSDGGLEAFPRGKNLTRIEPGSSVTFPDIFQALPPLEIEEPFLVFGTQEENPVIWGRFASPAVSNMTGEESQQGQGSSARSLERQLDRYIDAGTRGGARLEDFSADQTMLWTSTFVPTRVEANSKFFDSREAAGTTATPAQLTREYTVANFDVRPYLPDSAESGLYRVLMEAESLAKLSGSDGVPYKQHDWSGSSDAINLSRGIDCSRAIWFAFTRAGLPYTDNDRYLSTREMVGATSPMSKGFELCPEGKPLQPGDVLVYRDATRDAGHVVMVIDADKRIAWGSHGWDGNSREGLTPDRGVEYQRIKYKQDWERWDRSTMKRVACWRHRLLAQEALSPAGLPGTEALKKSCNLSNCK